MAKIGNFSKMPKFDVFSVYQQDGFQRQPPPPFVHGRLARLSVLVGVCTYVFCVLGLTHHLFLVKCYVCSKATSCSNETDRGLLSGALACLVRGPVEDRYWECGLSVSFSIIIYNFIFYFSSKLYLLNIIC